MPLKCIPVSGGDRRSIQGTLTVCVVTGDADTVRSCHGEVTERLLQDNRQLRL